MHASEETCFQVQVHKRQREAGKVSLTQRARKSFLIKRGDCEEAKRPFGGKKCSINVEEVETFCEIFFACSSTMPDSLAV